MPRQMRRMFAWMCLYCELGDPLGLWEAAKYHLIEGYRRRGFSEQVSTTSAPPGLLEKLPIFFRSQTNPKANFYLPDVNVIVYQPPQQQIDIQHCHEEADNLQPTIND